MLALASPPSRDVVSNSGREGCQCAADEVKVTQRKHRIEIWFLRGPGADGVFETDLRDQRRDDVIGAMSVATRE